LASEEQYWPYFHKKRVGTHATKAQTPGF